MQERSAMENGRWRFGVCEFDAHTLELWRNGRAVKVRPQSLRLLALLVSRPSELVTRAELQRGIWGAETFVDFDQGVNHCIKELRSALGDHAESPRYIETLARRGYRFIAPVERLGAPAASPAPAAPSVALEPQSRLIRRGWVLTSVLAVVVTGLVASTFLARSVTDEMPPLSAIAVASFTTEPVDAALGIGLADAIARRLGGQQALAIRGGVTREHALQDQRQSSAASRGATLVLHGEIITSGADLNVRVRLVPVAGGPDVWAERFRARADELFSVEDVIAERVVAALGLRLAAVEQERLRHRYTSNTAAYRDYLRGRALLVRYTPEATLEAIAAFEAALQRDPEYVLARAGLAMACADMCLRFASAADVDRWAERAEAEARAALDLDPDLAEAHLARAAVARKREFDWSTAMAASRRALMLNPNLDQAHFFMAAAYYHLGYMEEALIAMQKGRALRGGDLVEPRRIEALVALFSGNFAPALAHLEEVSRLSSQAIGDTYLALAAYYTGGIGRGRTMLEALTSHTSTATAMRSSSALAGVLAAQGDATAARAHLDRVLGDTYRDHHVAYSVGVAYAQLGEMEPALQWLRTAADTGFPCLPWFERDPLLEPLRRQPRFHSLVDYVRERRNSALPTTY